MFSNELSILNAYSVPFPAELLEPSVVSKTEHSEEGICDERFTGRGDTLFRGRATRICMLNTAKLNPRENHLPEAPMSCPSAQPVVLGVNFDIGAAFLAGVNS